MTTTTTTESGKTYISLSDWATWAKQYSVENKMMMLGQLVASQYQVVPTGGAMRIIQRNGGGQYYNVPEDALPMWNEYLNRLRIGGVKDDSNKVFLIERRHEIFQMYVDIEHAVGRPIPDKQLRNLITVIDNTIRRCFPKDNHGTKVVVAFKDNEHFHLHYPYILTNAKQARLVCAQVQKELILKCGNIMEELGITWSKFIDTTAFNTGLRMPGMGKYNGRNHMWQSDNYFVRRLLRTDSGVVWEEEFGGRDRDVSHKDFLDTSIYAYGVDVEKLNNHKKRIAEHNKYIHTLFPRALPMKMNRAELEEESKRWGHICNLPLPELSEVEAVSSVIPAPLPPSVIQPSGTIVAREVVIIEIPNEVLQLVVNKIQVLMPSATFRGRRTNLLNFDSNGEHECVLGNGIQHDHDNFFVTIEDNGNTFKARCHSDQCDGQSRVIHHISVEEFVRDESLTFIENMDLRYAELLSHHGYGEELEEALKEAVRDIVNNYYAISELFSSGRLRYGLEPLHMEYNEWSEIKNVRTNFKFEMQTRYMVETRGKRAAKYFNCHRYYEDEMSSVNILKKNRIVFKGGEVADTDINMFHGWAGSRLDSYKELMSTPFDEDYENNAITLFYDHILSIWCGGNVSYAEYVMKWFGNIVQNPGVDGKNSTAIFVTGIQGTGKTLPTKLVMDALGRYVTTTYNDTTVIDRFNSTMANKVLVNFDEASVSNISFSQKLKNLITSEFMLIEAKYMDARSQDNLSSFIITTNSVESVIIEDTDRRYLVLETSNELFDDYEKNDRVAYFEDLASIDLGELLYGLENWNIVGFNASGDLPTTVRKVEIQKNNAPAELRIMANMLLHNDKLMNPSTEVFFDRHPENYSKLGDLVCPDETSTKESRSRCLTMEEFINRCTHTGEMEYILRSKRGRFTVATPIKPFILRRVKDLVNRLWIIRSFKFDGKTYKSPKYGRKVRKNGAEYYNIDIDLLSLYLYSISRGECGSTDYVSYRS